jgi:hypothetical protein
MQVVDYGVRARRLVATHVDGLHCANFYWRGGFSTVRISKGVLWRRRGCLRVGIIRLVSINNFAMHQITMLTISPPTSLGRTHLIRKSMEA